MKFMELLVPICTYGLLPILAIYWSRFAYSFFKTQKPISYCLFFFVPLLPFVFSLWNSVFGWLWLYFWFIYVFQIRNVLINKKQTHF